jgi:membrane protein
VLGLAVRRFWAQNMFHHAAAVTYQSVLSLFQALLLAVALLGLLGSEQTLDDLARSLDRHGVDPRLVDGLIAAARHAVDSKGTSAAALAFGLVLALFVSSSAFLSASVALNVVLEARDDRGPVRRRLHALGAISVVILVGIGALIAVFLGGGLAERLFGAIGLGDTAATLWSYVRLPLGALLALTAFAWMYFAAPTAGQPSWRWISLGATVAVVVWLAASLGLFEFVAHVPGFNATYGAFATAILLLVWLWLTSVALLLGAEVNAAGRHLDGVGTPISTTGDNPEGAQHEAAKRRAETEAARGS